MSKNFSHNKDNLCLYGHPNETWEVTLPAENVRPEIPEPVLGINFARDGMQKRDWLSLVAMHTDLWLLLVVFYFGAQLNRNESPKGPKPFWLKKMKPSCCIERANGSSIFFSVSEKRG